jgi:LCP family protein required for cell wall assembly
MLAITLAIGGAVLGVWLQGPVYVLRLLVQPDVLLALLVANAIVFAFRAHCVVDAYRSARRERLLRARPRGTVGGRVIAVALLLTCTAAPHVVAGYYDFRDYDLLTSVFASDEPVDPEPVPVQTHRATVVPAARDPGAPGGPTSAVVVVPATTSHVQKPPARVAPWQNRGRLNLLLVGGDAGPGRWGIRTDTMIVLSVNLKTERAAVFSVPRNWQHVPFPTTAHTDEQYFDDILNALWQYAERTPSLFPGAPHPGATALEQTLGQLLGLHIDYYAAVDLRGFVEMVDALGGVTVQVQRHVWDAGVSPPIEGEPWIAIDLEPGPHHLDGRQALAYVRTRWASSDYDRMQRQRCTIRSLVQQASLPKLLRAFPRLASAAKRYVQTDIPVKALPDLIELITSLDTQRMVGVSFVPPQFGPVPDAVEVRGAVRAALAANPAFDDRGIASLRQACG